MKIELDSRRSACLGAHVRYVLAIPIVLLAMTSASFAGEANWSRDDAAHLLRRAGFGGTPVQIDRIFALGRDGAVEYLVSGKLPAGVDAPFPHVELTGAPSDPDDYLRIGGYVEFELRKMRSWWLDRMVRTDRPLEEKMTLFWHGIFCSGFVEVRNIHQMADQNELFRHEAIGNYKRLTHAIIHDPAMLRYLNNDHNLKGRPNENLARELMELFTMGEGNGYTEKDIPEVARALTGMAINREGKSEFQARYHVDAPKTVFGKTGNYLPDDVVDLIFDRPEPSIYLSRRLWDFFGTSDPSEQDVTLVSDALRKNNWELASALRALFSSPSFYSEHLKFARIKSPVDLEVMTLRLLEEPPHPRVLSASAVLLREAGEELFQPPNVKGWPGGQRWITSTTIFLRYHIAAAMANGVFGLGFGHGGRLDPAAIDPSNFNRTSQYSPSAAPAHVTAASAKHAEKSPDPKTVAGALALNPNLDPQAAKMRALRLTETQRVEDEVNKMPALPPPGELVVPSKLFAALGTAPTHAQLVDAAIARFVQHPLAADKKATLLEALGTEPLTLGEPKTDHRVRQMIGVLLSTPEYQVE